MPSPMTEQETDQVPFGSPLDALSGMVTVGLSALRTDLPCSSPRPPKYPMRPVTSDIA